MAYCKVPHKQGWTKVTNWYSWYLGLNFHPLEKANAIADCLENQVAPHDLCDENHKHRVEAIVQSLLETRNWPQWKKLINFLKLRKVWGIDGIPNECLRHLPRRSLVHLTHLINHCIRPSHFSTSWKKRKWQHCQDQVRTLNSPKSMFD
jgi:hypothetical protein